MPQENISVGKEQNYLLVGDNAIWLKKIPDNSIDSIVTDPPAGISFMGRGWDTDKGGRDHWIAWMQEVATECKRVLKPGGHAFVWAIPRTSHWTATAWENAGFEIRDVVAHIFGSGFPKSLNIGKAVDKLQGNEREDVGESKRHGGGIVGNGSSYELPPTTPNITKGTSPWEGWGTALKPAREDWLLMRKPIESKTVAENVLKYGTGGINIDESRVEYQGEADKASAIPQGRITTKGGKYVAGTGEDNTVEMDKDEWKDKMTGRFPANLITDGSEEVRECFPDVHGAGNKNKSNITAGKSMFGIGDKGARNPKIDGDNGGNASRFFKSIVYKAKASKSERNKGCDELEKKENAGSYQFREDGSLDGKPTEAKSNFHPTVKPIALMEYLIKMVTPKGGIVLDPFAGSGSTLVAAKQNGYQYIGIEMTAEYIPIIEARLGL